MVSFSILILLFVGAVSAAPVVQDDWEDIVKTAAQNDLIKILLNAINGKRDVQDDWEDIVMTAAQNDLIKILLNAINGKRDVQDDLADIFQTIEAKIVKVVEDALKVIESSEKRQEVQDGWGSIITDGAAAVNDVINLGESIGHLVSTIKNGK